MIKYLEIDKDTLNYVSGPWYAEVLPVFAEDSSLIAKEVLAMPDDGVVPGQVWNDTTCEIEDTQVSLNHKARWQIAATDWKVVRHLEQQSRGGPTSLIDSEYEALCLQRDVWRLSVVE